MTSPPDPYPPMRYVDYALIPQVGTGRLLLWDEAAGPALPRWEPADRHFWQAVAGLNAAVGLACGVPLTTLRLLDTSYDPYHETIARLYLMEAHARGWEPQSPGRWAEADEVAALPDLPAEWPPLIRAWAAETTGTALPLERAPWTRPGWWAGAIRWIDAQCRRLGGVPVGGPVQVRTWGRSCVAHQPAPDGGYYFKAVPPMFAYEPALTAALAADDPAHFPAVVAWDAARGWMLMRALAGVPLDTVHDPARWEAALRAYAGLQIRSIALAPTLRAAGCPDRGLDRLAADLDPFLAALSSYEMRSDEIAALRARGPDLHSAIQALAALDLPLALDHGDLGPWNIMVGPGADEYQFFDLSDSSLTQPFFSLTLLLAEATTTFHATPDAVALLRAAYLQPWTACAAADRLARAWDLAATLAPWHHALTYHSQVLPGLGPDRGQMVGMVRYYLRLTHEP
ncbi:MAG: phosphotransferase [Chloroflexota bacterium]|nr:phosphotransferase [Chloroflexota bacterium]